MGIAWEIRGGSSVPRRLSPAPRSSTGHFETSHGRAGWLQPDCSRKRLASLRLSPPARCGSRAWVRGSCAARVTGATFASLVQGWFIKPASWILNHLTFSYQRCPGRSCGGWSGSWQPATRYPKAGWAGVGSRFSISPWAKGDVLGWRACRGLCRLVKDHVMPL